MNQTTAIVLGVLVLGGAGAAYYFLREPATPVEEKFTIRKPDGTEVTGTREELYSRGYMEVYQDGELKWISKEDYEAAEDQSGGNPDLFASILTAIGAVWTVVQTIRN